MKHEELKNSGDTSPSPIKNGETLMPVRNTSSRQLKNHVHVSVRLKPIKADDVSGTSRQQIDRNKHWKVLNSNQIQ